MSDAEALAAEVQAWVDANWNESLAVGQWWERLVTAGYAYPSWPTGVGGSGASSHDAATVTAVLARNQVVGPAVGGVAATLAAPTLLAHGSREQIHNLVRPIALGETVWCQLFSEPGSGSDLASLSTRAVRDGRDWIVTGQKVWNSAADVADFGMLLARTDPDQPKHRGITYFVIEMRQPGIEVRPLRQMNGVSSFCEVFLNEAWVRADRVVGEVNGGWPVAQTTLAHERKSIAGGGVPGLRPARSGSAGDLDRPIVQLIERARQASRVRKGALRGGAVPSKVMIELARAYRAADGPSIRQDLARYVAQVRVNGWTMRRIAAADGRLTGADGSIAKLATSRICQVSRDLSYRIVGANAMLAGPASPLGGDLQTVGLASPGTRLGGGTDEIQLNVLGERGLGLPREPSHDREVPYRDIHIGTQG